MTMRGLLAATMLLVGMPAAVHAQDAAPSASDCVAGICRVTMTPDQLLARAEALVRAGRYAEAEPLIAALAQAPNMKIPSRFLAGYAAAQQGRYAAAADSFKAILADDPSQTAVRLALGRAMLNMGQMQSADRQFKLAEQGGELPPDVARAIRGAREVIRSRRAWRFDVDFGIAPDSNINNATGASAIDVQFGDVTLPVSLDGNARARSGTGQTANISAGVRLPVGSQVSMLVDVDTNGTNYAGRTYDDYLVQAAAGPELRLSQTLSVSVEGVAAQRWFGGRFASRQVGVKGGAQIGLGARARLGVQLDARHTDARFDANYSGWQAGLYATGEHAVGRSFVGSAGLFARRDWLTAAAYSNTELGGTLGFGGELPLGISFGLSGSLSRARFDAPIALFSREARRDWRYGTRLTLGNRKVRVLGFSPQMALSYNRNDSSLPFFATDRLRVNFAVARYF